MTPALLIDDVQPPEAVDGVLDHRGDLLLVGDVGLDRQRRAAALPDLLGELLEPVAAPGGDRDRRSARASSRAVASPIPLLAPVTSATVLSKVVTWRDGAHWGRSRPGWGRMRCSNAVVAPVQPHPRQIRHDRAPEGRVPGSWHLCSDMDGRFATTAWIASRQHGRVAWRQLVAAGVDRHTIERWRRDGRLREVHVGVYAVGHLAPSLDGDYMAAVLASGEGAVLSHWAAVFRLRLLRGHPPAPETTVPTTAHRRRPGIVDPPRQDAGRARYHRARRHSDHHRAAGRCSTSRAHARPRSSSALPRGVGAPSHDA